MKDWAIKSEFMGEEDKECIIVFAPDLTNYKNGETIRLGIPEKFLTLDDIINESTNA